MEKKIRDAGRVTAEIRKTYFRDLDFMEIREWLEAHGLDRHTPLELESVEIALKTPFGIMMQIRPSDHDQLGLWGGVLNLTETPEEGAVRELREETGLIISKEQLHFKGVNEHYHEYANGDKAYFIAHRFVVEFDHVPNITTDEESVGAYMVTHTILRHQQLFIKELLGEEN